MSEPDIEKAKGKGKKPGKRRRSARVYVNANKPLAVNIPEIAALFPPDDGDDGQAGTAEKAIAAAGNPFTFPGGRNPLDRVSPSRVTGQQSPSSGDHGAGMDPMNRPGPSELAFRHPDMRQGTTTPFPLATMGTDDTAFPRDLRGQSNGVAVALQRLDAAAAAGMPGPPANPFSRPGDHIAQNSAMPPNGTHGLSDPASHAAPMATKGSDALRIMRQNQRRV